MWVPFAEMYGIKPWEFPQLSYAQFCALESGVQQRMRSADG